MFLRKNKYVTEEQFNRIANRLSADITSKALYTTDLLNFYRQSVQKHSEELTALRAIIKEAGLIVELKDETDNSVVEYLGTKWKVKKVK